MKKIMDRKRKEEESLESLDEKLTAILAIAFADDKAPALTEGEAALLYCIVGGPCSKAQKDEFKAAHPSMGDVPLRAYPNVDQAIAMFRRTSDNFPSDFEVEPFFKEDLEEMGNSKSSRCIEKRSRSETESFF